MLFDIIGFIGLLPIKIQFKAPFPFIFSNFHENLRGRNAFFRRPRAIHSTDATSTAGSTSRQVSQDGLILGSWHILIYSEIIRIWYIKNILI